MDVLPCRGGLYARFDKEFKVVALHLIFLKVAVTDLCHMHVAEVCMGLVHGMEGQSDGL